MEQFGVFELGLSHDEEERAARLHRTSIIVDMLFQGPLGYRAFTDDMVEILKAAWSANRDPLALLLQGIDLPVRQALAGELPDFQETWDASGVTGGNRQVELVDLDLFGIAQAQFDAFEWLRKALVADDFRQAKNDGGHAGFLSTQLTLGPFETLDRLRVAYDLGLRMLQLTYNSLTTVGAGCTERTDAGVSRLGAQAIATMNELGIIVDTAHCGVQTTLDACDLSTRPVVASHTAAASVHAHDRAKSDPELEAIAGSGGVIGLVTVPFFLSDAADASIHDLLDHIDHVSTLVGAEHVAIGTDWPMQLPTWALRTVFSGLAAEIGFREEHRIDPTRSLIGFDDYRDFANITRGLVARGYDDGAIRGILGENFLRVFAEVCG